MKARSSHLGIALCLAHFSSPALADDMVALYGIGTNSCGSFLASQGTGKLGIRKRDTGDTFYPESSLYENWLGGYVTAYNVLNADKPGVKMVNTDIAGIMGWIKVYCEKNPTQQVLVAINSLIRAESHGR